MTDDTRALRVVGAPGLSAPRSIMLGPVRIGEIRWENGWFVDFSTAPILSQGIGPSIYEALAYVHGIERALRASCTPDADLADFAQRMGPLP